MKYSSESDQCPTYCGVMNPLVSQIFRNCHSVIREVRSAHWYWTVVEHPEGRSLDLLGHRLEDNIKMDTK
jgi:hypothetical protein